MSAAPAIQIRDAIVQHLRGMSYAFSLPVAAEQIRGTLDLSGELKGLYGVTVAAEDGGDWAGNTNRTLVSIRPRITVFTHLEDDVDGVQCDVLTTDLLNFMQQISYTLEGWQVAWNGNWQISSTGVYDSFRQNILTATIPIVKQ